MEDQSHNIANQSECPSLCRAGCGFFGSPSFQGFCSKCYRDYEDRKTQNSTSCLTANRTPGSFTESRSDSENTTETCSTDAVDGAVGPDITITDTTQPDDLTATSPPTKSPKRNRCFTCRKKVGLTGFECRCGNLYCSLHRYADKHECSFDYKKMGREEIQKRNPKVVAVKIERI